MRTYTTSRLALMQKEIQQEESSQNTSDEVRLVHKTPTPERIEALTAEFSSEYLRAGRVYTVLPHQNSHSPWYHDQTSHSIIEARRNSTARWKEGAKMVVKYFHHGFTLVTIVTLCKRRLKTFLVKM